MTFGQVVAEARKKAGLSQKDLAAGLRKEDGEAISPQYLNDIERDRRNPPNEFILKQLASVLSLPLEFLLFKAGQWPEEMRDQDIGPQDFQKVFQAFRRDLEKGKPS
jgi:transcriptional regulator with XRE-family HTH domain